MIVYQLMKKNKEQKQYGTIKQMLVDLCYLINKAVVQER